MSSGAKRARDELDLDEDVELGVADVAGGGAAATGSGVRGLLRDVAFGDYPDREPDWADIQRPVRHVYERRAARYTQPKRRFGLAYRKYAARRSAAKMAACAVTKPSASRTGTRNRFGNAGDVRVTVTVPTKAQAKPKMRWNNKQRRLVPVKVKRAPKAKRGRGRK